MGRFELVVDVVQSEISRRKIAKQTRKVRHGGPWCASVTKNYMPRNMMSWYSVP